MKAFYEKDSHHFQRPDSLRCRVTAERGWSVVVRRPDAGVCYWNYRSLPYSLRELTGTRPPRGDRAHRHSEVLFFLPADNNRETISIPLSRK